MKELKYDTNYKFLSKFSDNKELLDFKLGNFMS